MSDQTTPRVRSGLVPVLKGDRIDVKNAGALAMLARGDVNVREGGAQMMLAGGDLSVEQGGAQMMLARGDITIQEAGAMAVGGATVAVTDGWVGIAVGRNVDVRSSRVLLGPLQAVGLGAGFGIAYAIVRRLIGK